MAKGENIFKRKDGRWEARYPKGRDLDGKIKYGFCYGKSYHEAKEKVMQCKAITLGGRPAPQSVIHRRLAFYCDEWLQKKKKKIRESTYIKYNTILEKHIKPRLGNCHPQGLTTDNVDDFTDDLLFEDELSVKTVHDILVVLHGVLRYVATQCPGASVIEINYPKEAHAEMRVLSLAEQERLIRYLRTDTDPCKFGLLFMLLSGVRIGELCALKWSDIDLEEQTVHITATLQRLHNTTAEGGNQTHIVIGAPKSEKSIRTIPLTDYAATLCHRFANRGDTYLLTGTEDYMEPRTLEYRFQKYTQECGLEGVHPHTLRHTFATRAVEAGFDIKSLSEILGHASTTITLERYVHSSLALKRTNMEKLDKVAGF